MAGVVCLGFWLLPAQAQATLIISGDLPPGIAPAALASGTFGLILCWLIASFVYLTAALRRLHAYRTHIRQHYSDVERRDLRWVGWMMAFLLILWVAAAASLAAENLGNAQLLSQDVLYGLTACNLVFLTVFVTKAAPASEPETPHTPTNGKYARSALSPDHAAKLAQRIEGAMRKDTLFLDPNLSLQKLSRHISAPPNLVSQTLNEVIGSPVFDYVAHWRIKASKPLLLESKASVLTIALDVGFNSRSTFYKAFKREIGVTPQAFRKTQRARNPDVKIAKDSR